MAVLITGGTGFVGHWLERMAPGFPIVSLGHEAYDEGSWKEGEWEYIFHLAPVDPGPVLEYAQKVGSRVLFASSGAAGEVPLSDWGLSKLQWEIACYASKVDVIICRMFTFTGAHLKWERFAIGEFIRDAVNGGPIRIKGNGSTVRSYMHGQDLGEWLWAAMIRGHSGEVYEVGSGFPVNLMDLAGEIAGHFTPRPAVNVLSEMPIFRQYYVPKHLNHTCKQLRVSLTIPFDQAVRRSIEDYQHEKSLSSL